MKKQIILDKHKVEEVFNKYWDKKRNMKAWDSLSQIIFKRLRKELGFFEGTDILEAGSGSGRISYKIARFGGNVTLLDISPKAINISKRLFKKSHLKGNFAVASIFKMPFPKHKFDVVWNAGVLEHFNRKDQIKALNEMKRVCKLNGLIITLHPYAGSFLYMLGKKVLQKKKKWEYGELEPIITLKPIANEVGLEVINEFPEAFCILFTESFRRFLKGGSHISDFLEKIHLRMQSKFILLFTQPIDRFLAKVFGGYLITTIMRDNNENN